MKRLRQTTLEEVFGVKKRSKVTPNGGVSIEINGVASSSCPDTRNKMTSHVDLEETSNPLPKLVKIASVGCPLDSFLRTPQCSPVLPTLKPSADHSVLLKFNSELQNRMKPPSPFPISYTDAWDANHVRLPCSDQSLYPAAEGGKLMSRWAVFQVAFANKITNCSQLHEAILKYNSRFTRQWKFKGFYTVLEKEMSEAERQEFFESVLPKMISLALNITRICSQPIPLLKAQQNKSVTLTQEQAACLLCHAFFCSFPRRNSNNDDGEYTNYPWINFNHLFNGQGNVQKLRCLLHYFKRVTEDMPTGTLTFTRQGLDLSNCNWRSSTAPLTRIHISQEGTIEDFGDGMLQVDFANKFLGGGVLTSGCVQEEIRFVICPELIISCLLTEALTNNECLIMKGAERFSYYTGYSVTFKWAAPFKDETPRDSWGRREVEIVAIDAEEFSFRCKRPQFGKESVVRELNKAYCGFHRPGVAAQNLSAVATGNWGCGAFGGDKELKGLIQLMAASEAKRDVVYFTFGDHSFMKNFHEVYELLQQKQLNAGEVFQLIMQYCDRLQTLGSKKNKLSLFQFIEKSYGVGSTSDDSSSNTSLSCPETP